MESSRLFVKGLPPNITAEDLRKHFSKQGTVTDARAFGNRRIGYIGYKNSVEAANALQYFNKTYYRLSKLSVELAEPVSR